MLKILSSEQLHEADAYTIKQEPVSSIDLMERAATACYDWIRAHFSQATNFVVLCGRGNNGADGLALSRLLLQNGYEVKTYDCATASTSSDLHQQNKSRLLQTANHQWMELTLGKIELHYNKQTILIDALFGSGLNRSVDAEMQKLFTYINQLPLNIISIDLPSGLFAEPPVSSEQGISVFADYTLTFHSPKISFLLPESGDAVGKLIVLDIGIHPNFVKQAKSNYFFVTNEDIENLGLKRAAFSHKGTFGHALLRAGSASKPGAALLAVHAALRSGAGLVSASIPTEAKVAMHTALPEAMLMEDGIQLKSDWTKFSAVGIGPGIGTGADAASELKLLIQGYDGPIVFDADAITLLSENKTWLGFVQPNAVFTPHLKEFERLCGKANNAIHRLQMAAEFCSKYQVYLILKGKYSCTICPDGEHYFNPTGNPGMAKGGSGDVLTGLLTGMLAQGYSTKAACILATYLHGMAGDYAAGHFSETAMKAGDIIACFGEAFKNFSWENTK